MEIERNDRARVWAGEIGLNDRGAEGELCRRMAPRIHLYGLRGLRDRHAADDLVQRV